MCERLGADPYLAGNVGSGTVQELSQWVQYVNFDGKSPMSDWRKKNGREKPWNVKYWGVGNEAWGCGGNMTAGILCKYLQAVCNIYDRLEQRR